MIGQSSSASQSSSPQNSEPAHAATPGQSTATAQVELPAITPEILSALPPAVLVPALVLALQEKFQGPVRRDALASQYSSLLVDRLATQLKTLAETVTADPLFTTLETQMRELSRNAEKREARAFSVNANTAAKIVDDLLVGFTREALALQNLKKSLQEILRYSSAEGSVASVDRSSAVAEEQRKFRILEQCSLLQEAHVLGKDFPAAMHTLGSSVKERIRSVFRRYPTGASEAPSDDEEGGMFAMFLPKFDQSEGVPLFRNNPMLTCYLHETLVFLADCIPVVPPAAPGKSWRINGRLDDEFAMAERYVINHADGKLRDALQDGKKITGQVMEGLMAAYKLHLAYDTAFRASGITETKNELEALLRSGSSIELPARSSRTLLVPEDRGLRNFAPDDIFHSLRQLSKAHRPESLAVGTLESDRDRGITELYDKLIELLDLAMMRNNKLSADERRDRIKQLVLGFAEQMHTPDGRDARMLKRDIAAKNVAFVVEQFPSEKVKLTRVAVPGVRFEDLVGESWSDVRQNLSSLFNYSQLRHIYTSLTARNRVNNNTLVLGPYGCGKGMFFKALMSDPAVIGIGTSIERIMSHWLSRSESNVREMFDLAYRERIKHDKPAVIGWDEFDSLFQGQDGSCSGTLERCRKGLQTILDGDVTYEGVTLLAMSNEPAKIPVAIYRRFAHVEVIKKLEPAERQSLLQGLLDGIPLNARFQDEFDWDWFERETDFASGDLIGKLFDDVYRGYIDLVEHKIGFEGLTKLNERVDQSERSGERLTVADRRKFFQTASDVEMSAFSVRRAIESKLGDDDIRSSMTQQKNFYQAVRAKLKEAFSREL